MKDLQAPGEAFTPPEGFIWLFKTWNFVIISLLEPIWLSQVQIHSTKYLKFGQ